MVYFARQSGCLLVAEGIETEAQAVKMKALGCVYGQGYYFAHPLSEAEIEAPGPWLQLRDSVETAPPIKPDDPPVEKADADEEADAAPDVEPRPEAAPRRRTSRTPATEWRRKPTKPRATRSKAA